MSNLCLVIMELEVYSGTVSYLIRTEEDDVSQNDNVSCYIQQFRKLEALIMIITHVSADGDKFRVGNRIGGDQLQSRSHVLQL